MLQISPPGNRSLLAESAPDGNQGKTWILRRPAEAVQSSILWEAGGDLCPGALNDTAVRSRALRFYTCFLLKVVARCSVWPRAYAASLASGAKGHFLD